MMVILIISCQIPCFSGFWAKSQSVKFLCGHTCDPYFELVRCLQHTSNDCTIKYVIIGNYLP